jgi:hypothetical protein
LGRIPQILLPLQAFSYAFCIPIFVREKDRIIARLVSLVFLCSIPGIVMVFVSWSFPWTLLWLIGANYSNLGNELVVCAATAALSSTAGIAWNLVAHRGWNRWGWLQIPVGLGWCAIAPQILDVGSIEGALWLQAGFSLGWPIATLADLLCAYRRKQL